jgi:hypothetical protein
MGYMSKKNQLSYLTKARAIVKYVRKNTLAGVTAEQFSRI